MRVAELLKNARGCVMSDGTYRMYMMTPSDQISQDLSYFSGPNTSGAVRNYFFLVNYFLIIN